MQKFEKTALEYITDLDKTQLLIAKASLVPLMGKLRRHTFEGIMNAISYVIKTGCQWNMLPQGFPCWKTVYHHFRSLNERGAFRILLKVLVEGRRGSLGLDPCARMAVVDSQSVRPGLSFTRKGVDGNKKIKGIKRHVATDSNGYVLDAVVTTANVHDSKGAVPLLSNMLALHKDITIIKGDLAYVHLDRHLDSFEGITLECVKSNFGTPDFIPIDGRWVIERTFSWMEGFRRLNRNYEVLPKVATYMFISACVLFMLRYF